MYNDVLYTAILNGKCYIDSSLIRHFMPPLRNCIVSLMILHIFFGDMVKSNVSLIHYLPNLDITLHLAKCSFWACKYLPIQEKILCKWLPVSVSKGKCFKETV